MYVVYVFSSKYMQNRRHTKRLAVEILHDSEEKSRTMCAKMDDAHSVNA